MTEMWFPKSTGQFICRLGQVTPNPDGTWTAEIRKTGKDEGPFATLTAAMQAVEEV